jgi:hypothetical protein
MKDEWFTGSLRRATVPQPVNLRNDPFEQHMQSPNYPRYAIDKLWTALPAGAVIAQHMATYKDFPPRQAPPEVDPQGYVDAIR